MQLSYVYLVAILDWYSRLCDRLVAVEHARHHVSWLVQAGVDIRRVSELMRHSDISITASAYAHLAPNDLRVAVDVLDTPEKGGQFSRSVLYVA
jgi:integrase